MTMKDRIAKLLDLHVLIPVMTVVLATFFSFKALMTKADPNTTHSQIMIWLGIAVAIGLVGGLAMWFFVVRPAGPSLDSELSKLTDGSGTISLKLVLVMPPTWQDQDGIECVSAEAVRKQLAEAGIKVQGNGHAAFGGSDMHLPGNWSDDMKLDQETNWQTKCRGDDDSEYQIYLANADDGKGMDITTGEPLKSYDDWLNS